MPASPKFGVAQDWIASEKMSEQQLPKALLSDDQNAVNATNYMVIIETLRSSLVQLQEMAVRREKELDQERETNAKLREKLKLKKSAIEVLQEKLNAAVKMNSVNTSFYKNSNASYMTNLSGNTNTNSVHSANTTNPSPKNRLKKVSSDFSLSSNPKIQPITTSRSQYSLNSSSDGKSETSDRFSVDSRSSPKKAKSFDMSISIAGETVKIQAISTWSVQELIRRIEGSTSPASSSPEKMSSPSSRESESTTSTSSPSIVSNKGLFFKPSGKSHYFPMEESKSLNHYRKHIEDSDTVFLYGFTQNVTLGNKRSVKNLLAKAFSPSKVKKSPSCTEVSSSTLIQMLNQGEFDDYLHLLATNPSLPLDVLDSKLKTTPLHAAILSQDVKVSDESLRYCNENQLNINTVDADGNTILHLLVLSTSGTEQDEGILKKILSVPKVEADIQNNQGNTPLHLFCEFFQSPSSEYLASILYMKATRCGEMTNKLGETPIHNAFRNNAMRYIMINFLAKRNVNLDSISSFSGKSPLHIAIDLGRKDICKLLLSHGANPNVKDLEDKTCVESAATNPELASLFKSSNELRKWLEKLELEEFYIPMMKEDINLLFLVSSDESALDSILSKVGIRTSGAVIRVKHSLEEIKKEMKLKAFEKRLQNANRQPSFEPSEEDMKRMREAQNEIFSENPAWLIKHSDLEFVKELGSGSSGKVFKGLYQGKKVAIKVLKKINEEAVIEFKKEFSIMRVAANGPNIVRFLGASTVPRVCMVMEYCSRGSLLSVMNNPKVTIGWDRAFKFAIDMLNGMCALHSWKPHPILHRDIKSANLLLNKEWELKLCDMGLARFERNEESTFNKLVGTFSYVSPEVFVGQRYTVKSDIFSIGVILWEIFNRVIRGRYEPPYISENPDIKFDFHIAMRVAEKDLRPHIPAEMPTQISQLIQKCMDKNPELRPTAVETLHILQKIEESFQNNEANWSLESPRSQ